MRICAHILVLYLCVHGVTLMKPLSINRITMLNVLVRCVLLVSKVWSTFQLQTQDAARLMSVHCPPKARDHVGSTVAYRSNNLNK